MLSEARLRLMFEEAPVGVFVSTVMGRLLEVNATGARMLGYASPKEPLAAVTDIPGQLFVMPTERKEVVQKALDCEHSVQAEVKYYRKDGSILVANLHMRAVRDDGGKVLFLEGFVDDITKRKQVEAALQESEARHRLLVEGAPVPIGISRDGFVVYVNPKFQELFRCASARAQVGRPITHFAAPEMHDTIWEDVRRHSQGSPTSEYYEMVAQREDGTRFPVQVAVTSVELADGPAVLAFFSDVTKLKEAQAELQQHQQRLEELVAQRTAELLAINRDLEAFSYSASHDLKSPLRSIDGYAQILQAKFAATLPESGQEMLRKIAEQTARMSRLIEKLLAFSRLERQAMQNTEIDMDALAQEACAEQSDAYLKTNAQLKIHPLPRARGDGAMIAMVLNNLLSNAFKYSSARSQPIIEVGGFVKGKENVYFVKDNGVGFDMGSANELFSPFHRLHSKAEFEGTGVGLALAKRIMERHGGRIWAEAKVDEGATFSFALPAPQVEAVEQRTSSINPHL